MSRILCLLIVLLLFVPVQAFEARVGLLLHDVAPLWGNAKIEGGVDLSAEFIFGEGIIRPNMGMANNSQGHTSRVYGGVLFCYPSEKIIAEFGLGGCAQVNAVRKLGSTLLFRLSAEVGYRINKHSISILLDHISNANLVEHNAGLDTLGIRYGYRW